MKTNYLLIGICMMLPISAQAGPVESLLEKYRQTGISDFSASEGENRWRQIYENTKNGKQRSCSDCHSDNLKQVGKHAKTGKKIDPIAPSVNPKRLTDTKKIEKWLKRNCMWTLGRACTPQEKGDYLVFLQQQ
jgi:hypothetical protein